MKKLRWLTGGTFTLWTLLLYPGWLLWGDRVWVQSLTALALCLVPALFTLGWALKSNTSPEIQLVAILAGSGIRLAVAMGGGLLLHETLPEMFTTSFWLWMVLFYMFILAVETILVVKCKQNSLV
jgi:hypothetical protein